MSRPRKIAYVTVKVSYEGTLVDLRHVVSNAMAKEDLSNYLAESDVGAGTHGCRPVNALALKVSVAGGIRRRRRHSEPCL